jgi:C4-dicarboxylate transporter DctM subunit
MLIAGIVSVVILLAIGAPIFVALGVGGAIIIVFHSGMAINQLAAMYFDCLNSFVLLALPLFILTGSLMVKGGISQPIIKLFSSFTGRLPGGLAVASIIAATFIGALTGSVLATLAMVGLVMFPAMIEAKYNRGYSTGVLLSSSGLGVLIPPSLVFILFGYLTETSVGQLFMAGIIPGILVAALLAVVAVLVGRKKAPTVTVRVSWKERGKLFVKALPAIFTPLIILGGIYSGIFTPTEAAAVACVYSLIIGTVVYRQLKWKNIWASFTETAEMTGKILVLIAGGMMLGRAFMLAGLPEAVTSWVTAIGVTPMLFLLFVIVAYFLLGMVMENATIMFVFVPLIWPSVVLLGIDPLHFGVIVCIAAVIAGITPPMATTLFVTSSLFKTPIEEVTRGVLPFLFALILAMVIITFVPVISTWLPSIMFGG